MLRNSFSLVVFVIRVIEGIYPLATRLPQNNVRHTAFLRVLKFYVVSFSVSTLIAIESSLPTPEIALKTTEILKLQKSGTTGWPTHKHTVRIFLILILLRDRPLSTESSQKSSTVQIPKTKPI